MNDYETYYFAKLSNGKYYRGALFWRWTKSWRCAAALTQSEWLWLKHHKKIPWEAELFTLSEILGTNND